MLCYAMLCHVMWAPTMCRVPCRRERHGLGADEVAERGRDGLQRAAAARVVVARGRRIGAGGARHQRLVERSVVVLLAGFALKRVESRLLIPRVVTIIRCHAWWSEGRRRRRPERSVVPAIVRAIHS